MVIGLVIADDFTGAMDTGHQFATRGYRTTLNTHFADEGPDTEVRIVDTDSRTDSPESAYQTVSSVIEEKSAEITYKKIDSTLRGNVATEAAAVLDNQDPEFAIVAPAFPAHNRTTIGGYHLVDGDLLGTGSDYDAESPAGTANLITLFSDTSYPVRHVPIDVVTAGVDAVVGEFRAAKHADACSFVVCDAIRDSHLATIAAAGQQTGTSTYIGSAGLAGHIRLHDDETSNNRILGVVGSTNEQTIKQLSVLPDEYVIELDATRILEHPNTVGREAAQRASETIETTGVAILTSAPSSQAVATTIDRGHTLGLEPGEIEERVETALTTAVTDCWAEIDPNGVFFTGGTTAKNVQRAVGISTIDLTGMTVEPGIPVSKFEAADRSSVHLVTKAGGFGDRESIRHIIQYLTQVSEPRDGPSE
jgi:uncharacterized protein YgbK (DUF1537 family)